MLDVPLRVMTDTTAALIAVVAQFLLFRSLAGRSAPPWDRRFRLAPWITAPLIVTGAVLGFTPVVMGTPAWNMPWLRAAGVIVAMITTGACAIEYAARAFVRVVPLSEPRREFLRQGANALIASPVALTGYGVYVAASEVSPREVRLEIRGLPRDLDGLRIAQITDIHLSPYVNIRLVHQAVGMANEWKPSLAFLTGDFVSFANDPLEECLDALAALRAEAGVFGCLGNHEIVAYAEAAATRGAARRGMRILRNKGTELRFGNTFLNLVGVDYQRKGSDYLRRVAGLARADRFNVLLSHNPDVFPRAVQLGYDVTVSGHTHGGQVTVEYLNQYVNVAKFYTPYVDGPYELNGKALYVSRGLGTIGVPVRLGVAPEVSLIRLCAT